MTSKVKVSPGEDAVLSEIPPDDPGLVVKLSDHSVWSTEPSVKVDAVTPVLGRKNVCGRCTEY